MSATCLLFEGRNIRPRRVVGPFEASGCLRDFAVRRIWCRSTLVWSDNRQLGKGRSRLVAGALRPFRRGTEQTRRPLEHREALLGKFATSSCRHCQFERSPVNGANLFGHPADVVLGMDALLAAQALQVARGLCRGGSAAFGRGKACGSAVQIKASTSSRLLAQRTISAAPSNAADTLPTRMVPTPSLRSSSISRAGEADAVRERRRRGPDEPNAREHWLCRGSARWPVRRARPPWRTRSANAARLLATHLRSARPQASKSRIPMRGRQRAHRSPEKPSPVCQIGAQTPQRSPRRTLRR